MQTISPSRPVRTRRARHAPFGRRPNFRSVRVAFSGDSVDIFRPFPAFILITLHMVLALAMYRIAAVATLHALVTLLWFARLTLVSKRMESVAVAMAYVAGSEVLWRSTNALVPQEVVRYSICVLSIVALMRSKQLRLPWPPLIYFAFLVPSVLLTLTIPTVEMGADKTVLKIIVFNMIGPLSLMLCICFFSRLRLNAIQLINISLAFVVPATSLAFITILAIKTGGNVTFGRSSISVIREEFGPNQLSAAIGLGALFLFLMLILDEGATLKRRIVMVGGIVFLLSATAMTFSRGGIYNFGGAVIISLLFLLRDGRSRIKVFAAIMAVFIVGNYVVLPALDGMTNGFLVQRFTNTNLTGRDDIAWADLVIWRENPIYGMGPGRAIDARTAMSMRHQAHTEFTRMLAEHGVLGFISLLALLFMAISCFAKRRGPHNQAVTAALMVWSFLYMTNAAMRLVAPSFAFGLACALFNCDLEKLPLRRTKRLVSQRRKPLISPRHATASVSGETL